jgi:hypothetical protein
MMSKSKSPRGLHFVATSESKPPTKPRSGGIWHRASLSRDESPSTGPSRAEKREHRFHLKSLALRLAWVGCIMTMCRGVKAREKAEHGRTLTRVARTGFYEQRRRGAGRAYEYAQWNLTTYRECTQSQPDTRSSLLLLTRCPFSLHQHQQRQQEPTYTRTASAINSLLNQTSISITENASPSRHSHLLNNASGY